MTPQTQNLGTMQAAVVVLIVSLLLALLFLLAGGLAALGFRWMGWWGRTRKIFRVTAAGYLLFLPTFLFLLSPLLFSYLLVHAGTRPMDRQLRETPADYGCTYRPVRFPSRDQIQLSGWLLPGKATLPVLVVGHGLFRDRHEMLERTCHLNRSGYPALLLDFRGHGESAPAPVSLGFQERLDLLGACDFLRQETGTSRFILFGVSMGAVAALHAAPELHPGPEAIVADSPFSRLDSTVRRHVRLFLHLPVFPFADLFVWNLTRLAGFQGRDLDSLAAVRRLETTPLLLLYGSQDQRMPEDTAREIFVAIPDSRKELYFFEGAGHGHAYRSDPQRYLNVILSFLQSLRAEELPPSPR